MKTETENIRAEYHVDESHAKIGDRINSYGAIVIEPVYFCKEYDNNNKEYENNNNNDNNNNDDNNNDNNNNDDNSRKPVLYVLMVHNRVGWSFPKGHIEEGETPEEAAKREIFEETGVLAELDTGFSKTIRSAYKAEPRFITFYLGRTKNGMKAVRSHEGECRWFTCKEALEKIQYPPDRELLEEALLYCELSAARW